MHVLQLFSFSEEASDVNALKENYVEGSIAVVTSNIYAKFTELTPNNSET